ncbi:MAG: alanine--tRNA ligase [Clostridia bacterium]|nr:alanine--tRNA ligase [Clostridia bacterium]
MEWMGLNDIREKYLAFFESKGHLRLPSFSLMPQGDNSLLLINSGMAPMKKYFTGEVTPPRKRVTTCQKCIRTPDIERVGKTARHGTFFEMLGNFSFGDYFKPEATKWAWEFCTEVMQMPVDKLWVTIYLDDDEAFKIWTEQVGVPAERIVRLGKEDNFWEHGTGPCGPCSEIYFDRGEKYGCGKETCGVGCDCDRYTEFWNLVFTQFDSDGNGNYTPLEHPNIDTGMGLERLACIMQGVDNLFEVDTVQNIMKKISDIAGVKYHDDEKQDVSLRVITDHIRSATFMISDGVMPSNEGRGYVLRRLIRRACRHGRLLNVNDPFLYEVVDTVIAENSGAYPELADKAEIIKKVILAEEESFGKTIDAGLQRLNEAIKNLDGNVLSGKDAFKLNDTYGFPLDLTKDILEEYGIEVDEDEFNTLLENQKQMARAARKDAGADAWKGSNIKIDVEPTKFLGYTDFNCTAKVLAIVNSEGELVEALGTSEEGAIILDQTTMYALSGGQVGDTGTIKAGNSVFYVGDTTKDENQIYFHAGSVHEGIISVGMEVNVQVTEYRRRNIMRNHTAAHLLQAALREVLGTHVEQAGQMVNDIEVRFDFTHFEAMTEAEITKTEVMVNEFIMSATPVTMQEMPIEEAKKMGAMMLFGEKYGDIVRVVKAGDFSTEFCGGTHVSNSGELGLFKILSEASVASGVRRITAVTGANLYTMLKTMEITTKHVAQVLKANESEVIGKLESVINDYKAAEKKISALNAEITRLKSADMFKEPVKIGEIDVYMASLEGVTPDALRSMGDDLKAKGDNVVAVLATVNGDKANFATVCGKTAISKGIKAGNLVKEIATLAGGGGGGRPDSAMAGAKNVNAVPEAMSKVEEIIKSMLG